MFKYSGKVNKVMSAELLNFIKSNFNNKIKNAENYDQKKWITLSGHDSNIVQIMIALNLSTPRCLLNKKEGKTIHKTESCLDAPPYAS